MSFENMTPQQRIQAANIDCMRHPEFARLSGHVCMGVSDIVPEGKTVRIRGKDKDGKTVFAETTVPTACTDGENKWYGEKFMSIQNRKQHRAIVLHENFHVGLKHCTLYQEVSQKYPEIANVAKDFVVNGTIEELDPEHKFIEWWAGVKVLLDPKYAGWSFPQVFNDLMKRSKTQKPKQGQGKPGQSGKDGGHPQAGGMKAGPSPGTITADDLTFDDSPTLDQHAYGPGEGTEEGKKLDGKVDDANRQGEMIARKMRGDQAGGRGILETAAERTTDWKEPMREFIQAVAKGDDNSRFCPPNKRLLAAGFIMPSHFSETVGEIVIAPDTSGSMHGYYSLVFGEVARICQNVMPEKVRVLWWDTAVCGDQEFMPDKYHEIANLMHPAGGGGTTVSCVAQYMKDKEIKPIAVILLTDGYIESQYVLPDVPVLWGVVENEAFVPLRGKKLNIRQ